MALAAGGHADLDVRCDKTDHRQDPQAVAWVERVHALEWGAVERQQEVHRDRVDLLGAQVEGQLDQLLPRLTHARDEARARRQSGTVGLGHGVLAVGVGVRGADVLVVTLGRVEVVVVGVRPAGAELLGLAVLECAQAGADLDARGVRLDGLDDVLNLAHLTVARAGAAGDQAHAGGAGRDSGLGRSECFVGVQPRVAQDARSGVEALRAVEAVFRAQAALEVDQVVDLDLVAEMLEAQAGRCRHDLHQLGIGGVEYREGVRGGDLLTGQDSVGEVVPTRGCVGLRGGGHGFLLNAVH